MATGQSHSVREFAEAACDIAGISKKTIISKKQNFRPSDINELKGDYTKAKKILNWKPKTSFLDLVKLMVTEDIKRWELHLKGETFPWDVSYNIKSY